MGTLLDVEEAARRLNVRARFIRRLIAEDGIPYHKLGMHVRIASADLDSFAAAERIEPSYPSCAR